MGEKILSSHTRSPRNCVKEGDFCFHLTKAILADEDLQISRVVSSLTAA